MTKPNRYADDVPPTIRLEPTLRTAAGTPVSASAVITNQAPEPRILAATFLGIDADWMPGPSRTRVVLPGESIAMEFVLQPAVGTLPAHNPFAVTVQALDPVSGAAMSGAAIADVTLVVDAPGRIEVKLHPSELTRTLRGQVSVELTNIGSTPEFVRLEVQAPEVTKIRLERDEIEVPPGRTTSVPARVKIQARMFGRRSRFTYTVTARGSGAARRAEAAITTRAVFGATGPKVFVFLAVITLWAGLAIVFVPKLANSVRDNENKGNDKIAGLQNSAGNKVRPSGSAASGGAGKSGGSQGSGGAGKSGGSSKSGGSGGSGGSAAAAANEPVQFSGIVAGDSPGAVQVAIRPTSLVDEETQDAHGVGVNTASFTALGKIPGSALVTTTPDTQTRQRTTKTQKDGAWAFARVPSPGYYLVTFSKPGFQTQRYVVDAASAAAKEPLKVNLLPGQGRLSGHITGPSGAARGAKISLSDGTNTVTTSSNSKGNVGAWGVQGLSTPGTYLLTATKDGLSTESKIIDLAAGGVATEDLRLSRASTTLVGRVRAPNSLDTPAGVGGARVTASSGDVTRSSTTVTNGNLAGTYRLPDLPPGTYTVTTESTGYLTQTQRVVIRRGQVTHPIRTELTSAAAIVAGQVFGVQFDPDGTIRMSGRKPVVGPVNSAGVTLSSPKTGYKITTSSNGTFRVSGIVPGTYVVSAQYAGMTTAYATVRAVAGRVTRVPLDALRLNAANTADTSSITGFVSSAVSPSGTLVCPGIPQKDCRVTLTLHGSDGGGIDTRTTPSGPFVASPTAPASTTGPTAYTLNARAGLPPGIYHLTVGAPGFLTSTVTVRVPANTVAQAPQVALFPANSVSGNLSARDPLDSGPPGGGPYTACVYAIPDGDPAPQAHTCTPPPADTKCTTTGGAQAGYAEVDLAKNNEYLIGGLCNGNYTLYVVTESPWFVIVKTPGVFLRDGQNYPHSPHVPSLGHVLLTLQLLDPDTGQVGTAPALTGTVNCGESSYGDLSSAANNVVTVRGVPATASTTCTVMNAAAGAVPVSGRVDVSASNDNDTAATMTLTKQVGTVWGRVTSAYGSNPANAVGGKSLHLTGTAQRESTPTPYPFDIRVTTATNGCFAIAAGGQPVDTGTAECGTIPAANTADIDLASRKVHLSSDRGDGLDPYDADVTFSGGIAAVHIVATPLVMSSQKLTDGGAGADLSAAHVTGTPHDATGAGTIEVTSGADGTLTWRDSKISGQNSVSPGTYDLKATLPGFTDATATLTCPFPAPGTCSMTAFELKQQGGLSDTITGYLGEARTYEVDGDPLPHDYASEVLSQAVVKLTTCGDAENSPNCTGAVRTATRSGDGFTFRDGTTDNTLIPGRYQVTISATNFQTLDQAITIDAGANTLPQDYLFITQVPLKVGIEGTSGLLACSCQVKITRNDTGQTYSPTTEDSDHRYVFPPLSPANYQVAVSGPGFNPASASYDLPRGVGGYIDVPVQEITNSISGQVLGLVGNSTAPTGLNGVPVQLGHLEGGVFVVDQETGGANAPDLAKVTGDAAGSPGNFSFQNVPNGSYLIRYNYAHGSDDPKTGYLHQDTSTAITVVNGQNVTLSPQTTLTRVTHNVVLTITTSVASDDVTGATPTLTSSDFDDWTLTPQAPTRDDAVHTWKFLNVPFGQWGLDVTLPDGHFGALTGGTPDPDCTVGSTAAPVKCSDDLTVPGTGSADVGVDYSLNEHSVGFSVVAEKMADDSTANANLTRPSTVGLTLKDPAANTVFTQSDFPVSADLPAPPSGSLWGRASTSYTSSVTSAAVNWTAAAVTFSDATHKITLAEKGATVTVKVTLPGGAPNSTQAQVTLVSPGGGIVAPDPKNTTTNNHTVTFTNIPFATGWTAHATASYGTGQNATTASGDSAEFTVSSLTPPTVPVTLTVD